MFIENKFTVYLKIEPKLINNWKDEILKWIESNKNKLSNIENGIVIKIININFSQPVITGFKSIITIKVQVTANVFKPQINFIYNAKVIKRTDNYSLLEIPFSRVFINKKIDENIEFCEIKINDLKFNSLENEFLIIADFTTI